MGDYATAPAPTPAAEPQAVEDAPFPLTDTDRWVLSQTDEEYKYHSWEELGRIIGRFLFVSWFLWFVFLLPHRQPLHFFARQQHRGRLAGTKS